MENVMQLKSQIQTRQLTAVKNSSCQQYSAQSGFGLAISKQNRLSGKSFKPADGSTQNLGNALAVGLLIKLSSFFSSLIVVC
jgi:hypothetical protein